VIKPLALLLPLALLGCAPSARVAGAPAATYANPVFGEDFPDPAVLRAPDGYYYAYATQATRGGRTYNIQVARSRDLAQWEHLGDALPVKPAWAQTQNFWAPHVERHDGRYLMYYSAQPTVSDDEHGLCLAVAVGDRPEGPFTDMGHPLQCGRTFVNIDPFAYDDPATGRRLLYWGSGFGPIKVQELAADRMSFAPGSQPVDLVRVDPRDVPANYQRLVEGAWVILRGGWYYLFYSGDNCCGEGAHYAVSVARSRSATGPFETLAEATGAANSVVLERRGTWNAPGHNSIVRDAAGQDWMVYHAIDTRRPEGGRVMLIDRIVWRDGWPRVERPTEGPQPAPRVRR
jgi:arabinan endo-1,5-alpha-L-arabinosidase